MSIAYMDSRGIAKAHIIGISLGGWLTGWLLGNHGDRCLSSVMVAAAGNPAMGKPEIGEMLRKITAAGVFNDDRKFTQERLNAVVFNLESIDDELVDVRYTVYHDPRFRANLDNLLALTHADTYKTYQLTPKMLAGVTQDVLLCWGEDDKNSGIADAAFLVDNLPHSKLIQMNNTGHWPPYERPADFGRIAKLFFEKGLAAIDEGRQ